MPKQKIALNLGCNEWNITSNDPNVKWINIDADKSDKIRPDLQCRAEELPFEDNFADEIYAGHLLEHFDMHEGSKVLEEWHRVLKPGGVITITVPDVEKGIKCLMKGEIGLDWYNQIVFGATDRKRQEHHQAFTMDILAHQMSPLFKELIQVEDCPYWVANVNWQSCIQGKK